MMAAARALNQLAIAGQRAEVDEAARYRVLILRRRAASALIRASVINILKY